MGFYDRATIEKETALAHRMLVREAPKMFGYVALFYGVLGVGIPLRIEATRDVIWSSAKASLLFGLSTGAILLAAGTLIMSMYLLRKAPYADFGPSSSLTMVWSFRIFGVAGLPLAFWDLFGVVIPTVGDMAESFIQDWWL